MNILCRSHSIVIAILATAGLLISLGCAQSDATIPGPSTVTTTAVAPVPIDATIPPPTSAPSITPRPAVAPIVVATEAPTQIPIVEAFFLELVEPNRTEIIVSDSSIMIRGRTRVDAVVSVNDMVVQPDIGGMFQTGIALSEGVNSIEIVASVASGEQDGILLTVVLIPG